MLIRYYTAVAGRKTTLPNKDRAGTLPKRVKQMSNTPKSFSAQLDKCTCCPRKCGINRNIGQIGFCGIGADILVSHAGLHFGEEPPISGSRGSGTIFFCGCNLRCVFCQNYQISQEFQHLQNWSMTSEELAAQTIRLQNMGAHNINFVSPSHMVYQIADAIVMARVSGLTIPVVYNTGGYDSLESLKQIRGLVDIYLPDIKYMDNELARKYSGVRDYADIASKAIKEMLAQTGILHLDKDGVARRGVLVRHLVLPGHLENSRRCLEFLADLCPDIHVSIMSQYSPCHKAHEHPEINRSLTAEEYEEITDYALELGLDNAFIQDLESQGNYLPDFKKDSPFEPAGK